MMIVLWMVSGALIVEPLNAGGERLKYDSTDGLLSFPLLGVFGTKMQRDCTRMLCHIGSEYSMPYVVRLSG